MDRRSLNSVDEQKKLSSIDVSTFFLVFFVSILIGGVLGLVSCVILIWLSGQHFAVDHKNKHGISVRDTSRLGGVGIFLSFCLYAMIIPHLNEPVVGSLSFNRENLWLNLEILALLIALIGLVDDFKRNVPAFVRLALMSAIAIIGFLVLPDLLPNKLEILLDLPQEANSILLVLGGTFVLVGFANAANMVDGANGLLSLISVMFLGTCYFLSLEPLLIVLVLAILSFAIINILSGKILLGDFGAYGLGSLIVLISFYLYDLISISVWLYASLLSYPCFESVRALCTRYVNGSSLFGADNDHTHNRVYNYLAEKRLHPILANSLTGVGLALLSSSPAVFILYFNLLDSAVIYWFYVFLLQFLFFGVLSRRLRANRFHENGKTPLAP